MESDADNIISTNDGLKRKLVCGTEKGRHHCKNYRTAGMINYLIFIFRHDVLFVYSILQIRTH